MLINKLGDLSAILFCLEPTGHYSNLSVSELINSGCSVWLASGASIQKSIGLTRGKNDKIDCHFIFIFVNQIKPNTSFSAATVLLRSGPEINCPVLSLEL